MIIKTGNILELEKLKLKGGIVKEIKTLHIEKKMDSLEYYVLMPDNFKESTDAAKPIIKNGWIYKK